MSNSGKEWCPDSSQSPSKGPDGQITPDVVGALCSLGWRPILITGFLRDILTRHFSEDRQIEEPDLRDLIWREEPPTGILIESVNRWRGELVEMRPAIIIKRNDYKNVRKGIADQILVDAHGFRHFVTFWAGSHTLFCIHKSGAGAEILATEVQRELTQFTPVFQQALKLFKFQVLNIGSISEVEEASESFVVPINVGWAYEEKWTIREEALKLKKISFNFLLDC